MYSRRFIVVFFMTSMLLVAGLAFWNYTLDPLGHYAHTNDWNRMQAVVDEREQKIVRVRDHTESVGTALIGSSRVTYMQTDDFPPSWNVFNFAVANYSMRGYHSYVLYMIEQHPEVERFILGVDFFKANEAQAETPQSIDNYVEKVEDPLYKLRHLLSFPVARYGWTNARWSLKGETPPNERWYERGGDAVTTRVEQTEDEFLSLVETFEQSFYTDFSYYEPYASIMKKVNDATKGRETIVFTTPVSAALFDRLLANDLLPAYERWLRELIDVYGGVWHFMDDNSVTRNRSHYMDGHHYDETVGRWIAHRLVDGYDASDVPNDFGIYLDATTIDEYIARFKK